MSHITTVGIDFKVRTVIFDGFRIKMQIWDTAGQERFRNLSGTIYQGAEAIILVIHILYRFTQLKIEGLSRMLRNGYKIQLTKQKETLF